MEGKEALTLESACSLSPAEKQETQHHEEVFAAMVADIEMMPFLWRDILNTNVKMAIKHTYGLNIYDLEYEGLTPFPGISWEFHK